MKKIEIESLLDFKFVSAPGFSPDGKYAAFVVQTASFEENKYLGDLWLLDVTAKTTRKLTSGGDAKGYLWTKKGTLLFSAGLHTATLCQGTVPCGRGSLCSQLLRQAAEPHPPHGRNPQLDGPISEVECCKYHKNKG